jgi:hypothetical protein
LVEALHNLRDKCIHLGILDKTIHVWLVGKFFVDTLLAFWTLLDKSVPLDRLRPLELEMLHRQGRNTHLSNDRLALLTPLYYSNHPQDTTCTRPHSLF